MTNENNYTSDYTKLSYGPNNWKIPMANPRNQKRKNLI